MAADHTNNEEKSHSVSIILQTRLKFVLRRKKMEARLEILKELEEYDKQRKLADERSEIRELSNEEKLLQEMVFPDNLAFPIH